MKKWQFWVDRGGTFTDIVAVTPDRNILTCKLLSENPEQYPDAANLPEPDAPSRRMEGEHDDPRER